MIIYFIAKYYVVLVLMSLFLDWDIQCEIPLYKDMNTYTTFDYEHLFHTDPSLIRQSICTFAVEFCHSKGKMFKYKLSQGWTLPYLPGWELPFAAAALPLLKASLLPSSWTVLIFAPNGQLFLEGFCIYLQPVELIKQACVIQLLFKQNIWTPNFNSQVVR